MGDEVRYWFEEAANIPAANRRAFLEANCSDPEVRSEVLSLLEFDIDGLDPEREASTPEAIVKEAIDAVLGNGQPRMPVQRVGPFELGRLLGSGGMGLVYEAHRVDGAVRQRVAVKFAQVAPSAGVTDRENAHRRFARERQVLASLRHPYIAGLIDAGTTPDGMPYAVIEQVDGVPIDSYCDAWYPDQGERIRLVLKLCEAVQFAHRNLIVHSDVKPDNVLVTADGIPKLIDFGVASDLGDDATVTAMRAFTPGYASPEQSRGLTATVATDVYGLGAVLYRLLTGAKPRDVKTGSLSEVLRNISEEDVVRPSAIKPELKGDLENILLKALQREPQRRYGSVPELADDLNRYLARRPVRASPDSALYRSSRFIRRHWLPLVATAMLVVALVTATVISVSQRRNAMHRAFETRRLAERLLFEVHDEIEGMLGGTKAREKLGAIAVQYLEGLERDYGRDPELAWELLNAYSRLGQSRGGAASSVGDTESGSNLALKTLELGAVVEASSPDNDRLDKLFVVYDSLVPVFLEGGRSAQQRETIDRMLRLAPKLQPLREAQALKQLARYLDGINVPQQSAEAFARALTILRTLAQSPSSPPGAEAQLISTLVGYGRVQCLIGDFSGGIASLQEGIRLSESNSASDPHLARSARQLYWSHIALGDVFGSPYRFSLGRLKEAMAQYEKAKRIAEKLVAADPGNEVAKLDLARAYSREGVTLATSQPVRSLAFFERSHALVLETSPSNHEGLDSRFGYLISSVEPLVQLGQMERARLNTLEARRLLKELKPAGIKVNEKGLLRAESIRLFASGQRKEAIAESQRHLAMLSEKTKPALSENFESVEVLERIRTYAAGFDLATCAAATDRLTRVWKELRALYPESSFVLGQFDRSQTMKAKGCTAGFAAAAPQRLH